MRKGKKLSKAGFFLIIPLVLSHQEVLLWRSSVVLLSLSKNCLAPQRLFFYHRPHYFSQHLCSTLPLVSPNLCDRESCSKSERTISQIRSHSFNIKNTCWTDDWGESVSSLGTLWHHWILPPLQFNCIVRIFARRGNDDKSFLKKRIATVQTMVGW